MTLEKNKPIKKLFLKRVQITSNHIKIITRLNGKNRHPSIATSYRIIMNQFLKWAFLPLIIAIFLRIVFNEINALTWYDISIYSTFEIYLYGVLLALGLVSLWHNFLRHRCPQCRTLNPTLVGEEEIDRFIGHKEVFGKDGQGRRTTQHVSTTFARINSRYLCLNPDCSYKWNMQHKREIS